MKKVIIFTSSGGGGHISATQALKEYLGDAYDVHDAYIFRDVLMSLDFVRILTLGRWSNEEFFNFLISKKKYGFYRNCIQ